MAAVARVALAVALAVTAVSAQEPTLEYRVKAAYIFNFTQYVEWPADALGPGPLTICVAGRNVFGDTLDAIVRDERIDDHPVAVRVILEPEPGCHVLFIPLGAATPAYLRSARTMPVLTIGEAPDFIAQGGIINLVRDGGNIRFQIDQEAAERVRLRVSSRLLRLARPIDPESRR